MWLIWRNHLRTMWDKYSLLSNDYSYNILTFGVQMSYGLREIPRQTKTWPGHFGRAWSGWFEAGRLILVTDSTLKTKMFPLSTTCLKSTVSDLFVIDDPCMIDCNSPYDCNNITSKVWTKKKLHRVRTTGDIMRFLF